MKLFISVASVLGLAAFVAATPVEIEARSGSPLTQAQAEAQLIPNGITAVSSGGCTDRCVSPVRRLLWHLTK
ncbi:hypothetical protein DXG03_003022 [Asterophora parasitica]|uniref:Uncharacterized protein n=1 Tax=Asterophora parasitica TaxID=117018 RepID=A0A9P7FWV1_9AGAR|nr:hypothetical protein DXG03_003033 [Asterophora parasitica]KAG5639834.1 hypothetical protein DXG03_003022 [Asterophora parasitica]